MPEMIDCRLCGGKGKAFGYGCPGFKPVVIPCHICKGTGKVDKEKLDKGQQMKADRIRREMTLRAEAQRLGMKSSELCVIENGGEL